jgi:catechol 2,3-dioxygenase-like lactoylglutathione lyase family enzyme
MQPSAILESALYVTDLDAAENFYGEVMGLERIAKVPGRHVFFRCGQGVLLLFYAEATRQPPKPDARLPVPPHGTSGPRASVLCRHGRRESTDWKTRLEGEGRSHRSRFRMAQWRPFHLFPRSQWQFARDSPSRKYGAFDAQACRTMRS